MQTTDEKSGHSLLNGHFSFFREFVKHPLQLGAFVQSSRFLEKRIIQTADVASADVIVELGPGTGGTTRAILKAMSSHARLLTLEVNPQLSAAVGRIEDDRLIAHNGSALEIRECLARYELDAPNAVISGIPFTTIGREAGSLVCREISDLLAPGGCFLAYQVQNTVARVCTPVMGEPKQSEMEFFTLPPTRLYKWEKNGVASSA